jgi:hypothetical protein
MTDHFNFDVFLSHSSKDKPLVQPLAERLRQAGLRVWFDTWEIQPGNSIPDKIEEGLSQSRRVALCMSAHSFGADWVGMEINTILYKDPRNKKGRFIPIRLDDTEPKDTLAPFLSIDWRSQSPAAFQQLLTALSHSQPNFSAYADAWPHARQDLQLDFVDEAKQPTTAAKTAPNLKHADSFILRIRTQKPGQLILFLQNTDHTYCQLYPNTLTPPIKHPIGECFLPGKLLDLSAQPEDRQRLVFQAAGVERVLGFLLPMLPMLPMLATLPACIHPREPMSQLSPQTMQAYLTALHQEAHASMAVAAITVR